MTLRVKVSILVASHKYRIRVASHKYRMVIIIVFTS